MSAPETSLTNPITAEVWEGIRARHSLVESAGQPTEAARAMAYLSHLDRRDLIAEIERLQKREAQFAAALYAVKEVVAKDSPQWLLADQLARMMLSQPSAEPRAEPACGFGPCLIVRGEEWHDPNCPSLKSGE